MSLKFTIKSRCITEIFNYCFSNDVSGRILLYLWKYLGFDSKLPNVFELYKSLKMSDILDNFIK